VTRRSRIKGFRVSKSKTGKTILEPIACYGMNASAKIAQRKSKAVRVVKSTPSA
jgi:hypothetical protein